MNRPPFGHVASRGYSSLAERFPRLSRNTKRSFQAPLLVIRSSCLKFRCRRVSVVLRWNGARPASAAAAAINLITFTFFHDTPRAPEQRVIETRKDDDSSLLFALVLVGRFLVGQDARRILTYRRDGIRRSQRFSSVRIDESTRRRTSSDIFHQILGSRSIHRAAAQRHLQRQVIPYILIRFAIFLPLIFRPPRSGQPPFRGATFSRSRTLETSPGLNVVIKMHMVSCRHAVVPRQRLNETSVLQRASEKVKHAVERERERERWNVVDSRESRRRPPDPPRPSNAVPAFLATPREIL